MISSLFKKPESLGTSASGSMRQQNNYRSIVPTMFVALPSTNSHRAIVPPNLLAASERTTSGLTLPSVSSAETTSERTTSGLTLPSVSSAETTRTALNQLRNLSGLTWDQLARLFNVSRRSLHSWASGKPLSSSHEEQLNRLLATVQYINRGSASLNRSLLLTPSIDSKLPFDLLVTGEYETVKQILGYGDAPERPLLNPLSEEARASRRPPNPADLVDALQEPIHREVGRSRPGRAVRSRRNGSGE